MVVGESGLGKSTLINSLFQTDLYSNKKNTGNIINYVSNDSLLSLSQQNTIHFSDFVKKTVSIETSQVEIEERGVKLRLTIVDTPGFGDSVNSADCYKTIIKYIDDKFEQFLTDESGLNRRNISDNRAHCCFYFISPFGHGYVMQPLKLISKGANIIGLHFMITNTDF